MHLCFNDPASKRAASTPAEDTSAKKSRKSEPATATTTPSKPPPRRVPASAKAVLKSKESPQKANGTATPKNVKQKSGASSKTGSCDLIGRC